MQIIRTLPVTGVHCAGEVCDVVTGGILNPPGKTMFEKLTHLWTKNDEIRQLLLNEPRGRAAMCTNLIIPPCNSAADAGFIVMESEEYPPMSGANTIATTTVLLETGMLPMREPISEYTLDTPAGLVKVTAECENHSVKSVAFDNVPAFVFQLDFSVVVPDLGTIKVDIAWGGMIYVLVDARSIGLEIKNVNGARLVEIGERIKRAVQEQSDFMHPENSAIRGVSVLEFTEPIKEYHDDVNGHGDGVSDNNDNGTERKEKGKGKSLGKTALNTVVVSPGRLDRSPCGTGTCARLAVLHAREQLAAGETFTHRSIIGTEFTAHITGTTRVGPYEAVLPRVKGSAWITAFKTVVLDARDPFPEGFRCGDGWREVLD